MPTNNLQFDSFDDALYENVSCYSVGFRTSSGRSFQYQIGEFLRQVQAESLDHHVENLVDQAVLEKYKYCQWDRENDQFGSQDRIKPKLLIAFMRYRRWLRVRSGKNFPELDESPKDLESLLNRMISGS